MAVDVHLMVGHPPRSHSRRQSILGVLALAICVGSTIYWFHHALLTPSSEQSPLSAEQRHKVYAASYEVHTLGRASIIKHGQLRGTVVAFTADITDWTLIVGGLRAGGQFVDTIIVGIPRDSIEQSMRDYLAFEGVRVYEYDQVPCTFAWVPKTSTDRTCLSVGERNFGIATGVLPIEWGRYILMNRWLQQSKVDARAAEPESSEADGDSWALMIPDANYVLFQNGSVFEHFNDLNKQHGFDLVFIEEWAQRPHGLTNAHWYQIVSAEKCYGEEEGGKMVAPYRKKPVLVNAMIFGTRRVGINRFTEQLVIQFMANIERGEKCVPPHHRPAGQASPRCARKPLRCQSLGAWQSAEQPLINQLYYAGKFGASATALAYGDGPAISVGAACAGLDGHSLNDVIRKDPAGFIVTNSGQRASVLALYDRCDSKDR